MSHPDNPNNPPESALAWTPPPRVDRGLRFLSQLVAVIGIVAVMLMFAAAGEHAVPGSGPIFGWVVGLALFYVGIALHELGHLAAGKAMGMHSVFAYCGPVQAMAEREGYRWRWKRLPRIKGVPFAAVVAIPAPHKRFGPQFAWHAAGGPIANLVVGVLFFALSGAVPDGAWRGFAYGFSLLNLWLGLLNLIPSTKTGTSDGLRLLRAWRIDESDPFLALMRLNALAVTGTTADELPSDELEKLRERGPVPELLHLWFVLKALQNRARWHEAAAAAGELDRIVSELPEAERKAWAEHIAILDCEIRFSSLLAEGSTPRSPVDALTSETDWLNPPLRPRCLAAMAAVAGETEDAARWLAEAEQRASRSADAAQRISEGRLRAAIKSWRPSSPISSTGLSGTTP
jgi:hypothetical protein